MDRKVYPGTVSVRRKWGRPYASVVDENREIVFEGDFRDTPDDCIRELAGWLEDRGFVHPLTHDLED